MEEVRISYDIQPEDVIDIVTSILENLNVEYDIEDGDDFIITYKIKKKKRKKEKKKILVTHWDKNIVPEIFSIKGNSEKEFIYDVYRSSESLMYALGEDDQLLNEIDEGEINKEEFFNRIEFNSLDDFFKHLNSISDYSFREKF